MSPDSKYCINFDAKVKLRDFMKEAKNVRVKVTDFVKEARCPILNRYMRSETKLFFIREHYDTLGEVSDVILSVYLPFLTPHRTKYHDEFTKKAAQIYRIIKDGKNLLKSVETVIRLDRKLTLLISKTIDHLKDAHKIRENLEHLYGIKANKLSMARVLIFTTTHIRQ